MATNGNTPHNASDVLDTDGTFKSQAPAAGQGCQCAKCVPPKKKNGGDATPAS